MTAGSEPVDARADRAVQAIVAVIVLSGFVFRLVWVMPVLAVLLGAGAALGPAANPFHRAFAGWIGPRLRAPTVNETAATIHAQDILETVLLVTATAFLALGVDVLAWVIALGCAGVAAVAATTGVHLGVVARNRLRRR